jgi:hypothetical protein
MTGNLISPTFDPSDNVWFTDDGLEAKSLAELQRKLPDAQIVAYYPGGYGNVIQPRAPHIVKAVSSWVRPTYKPEIEKELAAPVEIPRFLPNREEPEEDTLRPVQNIPAVQRAAPPEKIRKTRQASNFERVDWNDPNLIERLKALVKSGLSSTQIGARFNCSRNAIIGICHRRGFDLKG